MENKVLTFLISSPHKNFTKDLYENFRNFLNSANVVVLHEFNHFYDCIFKYANDDFQFRLLIHSGLADSGVTNSGEAICKEIKGKAEFHNIDVSLITRKSDWFGLNEYSILRSDGEKYWNMRYFNAEIAINEFLKDTPIYRKGDLKNGSVVNGGQAKNEVATKPKIFIGSSSRDKALSIAQSIKNNLFNDKDDNGNSKYTLHIWNEGLFKTSKTNIENLEDILKNHDYGIFVFNGDDEIYEREINGTNQKIPRDNVIFEYGMFMGKYTRAKVFFVIPRPKNNLKIMSDLLGITALEYDTNDEEQDACVGVACNKIREELKKS
jgi:predicted nucleotide-binding protein